MTTIALVRHGQTAWNLERRIQGSTDIPLNDTGRAQAAAAAEALRDGGYRSVVASPLSRARQTAQIVADGLALPSPLLEAGLRERNYGEAEGMDIPLYRERYAGALPDGAESGQEALARAIVAVNRIAAAARAAEHDAVIAVAHGGIIRLLIGHVSGGTLPPAGTSVDNGSQHLFQVTPEGIDLLAVGAVS